MNIKKVIVIFKTHLDIGFTDFSKNVVAKYMNYFIPDAIDISFNLENAGADFKFKWTIGSWMISEYLRTQSTDKKKKLEAAIKDDRISWHGLPFTTHTELMSAALFQYGLSLSHNLDKQFNKKTISAKMTDVPGHTKAMIPYLKNAGIEFLHIGVNAASAVPKVPEIFRWQNGDGECINVMYHDDYGKYSIIGDTGVAAIFAHTHDNCGVQSADEIMKTISELRLKFPNAEIVIGDLNDVALEIRKIEADLPIIREEIGDTWIHGVGSDPKKVFWFKNLERFWEQMPDSEDREIISRALIMIPEHTWGLNVHRNLGDHENYRREKFEAVRTKFANYKKMEESWSEQRNYISGILNELTQSNRIIVEKIISEFRRENLQKEYGSEILAGTELKLGSVKIKFNNQGEIIYLEKNGTVIADSKHRLCTLIYEQFCGNDYKYFFTRYNRCEQVWAYEDYTKPGMADGSQYYSRFEPTCANVYRIVDGIIVRYKFNEISFEKMGCPLMFDLLIKEVNGDLIMDLAWFCKPANRVAEAIWIGFNPIATNKRIGKLGTFINPRDVVYNGQHDIHATDYGVIYDEMKIESLDAPLVSPKEPSLLKFTNNIPEDTDGVFFNLYNNVWGTNFPMWYDEDARFRFILHL